MTLSGAEYLAKIYGTDKDRVNCSFYFKIGACRHEENCARLHNKPSFSQTVLLRNMYTRRRNFISTSLPARKRNEFEMIEQRIFDDLFEEIYVEVEDCYGYVDEVNICDNEAEHMAGNVYIKFHREEDALIAVDKLNNRWFDGRPIYAELSPVTDFREACCRQYEMGECNRGGFCNFMHLKPISHALRRKLYSRKRRRELVSKRKCKKPAKSPSPLLITKRHTQGKGIGVGETETETSALPRTYQNTLDYCKRREKTCD